MNKRTQLLQMLLGSFKIVNLLLVKVLQIGIVLMVASSLSNKSVSLKTSIEVLEVSIDLEYNIK